MIALLKSASVLSGVFGVDCAADVARGDQWIGVVFVSAGALAVATALALAVDALRDRRANRVDDLLSGD